MPGESAIVAGRKRGFMRDELIEFLADLSAGMTGKCSWCKKDMDLFQLFLGGEYKSLCRGCIAKYYVGKRRARHAVESPATSANKPSTGKPQMPPSCVECPADDGVVECDYKTSRCYAQLWRHFVLG